jgi:hypothetical protein
MEQRKFIRNYLEYKRNTTKPTPKQKTINAESLPMIIMTWTHNTGAAYINPACVRQIQNPGSGPICCPTMRKLDRVKTIHDAINPNHVGVLRTLEDSRAVNRMAPWRRNATICRTLKTSISWTVRLALGAPVSELFSAQGVRE